MYLFEKVQVDPGRFELPTFRLSVERSNQAKLRVLSSRKKSWIVFGGRTLLNSSVIVSELPVVPDRRLGRRTRKRGNEPE